MVVTGRPGQWLPVSWPTTVRDLTPLTDEQADELISAMDSNLSESERAAVRARCDGVPFYLEQVVGGMSDGDGHTVPEALYEPLFSRLRARASAVPLVEAAATIGRQVDRGLLCSVCALEEDEIDRVLADLVGARVLEPWGADGWRFRHELLRDVALELAPPSVRRELHARVADALIEGTSDPDWRLVAGHYEQAQNGFTFWQLFGNTQQAAVNALTALHTNDVDPTALTPHLGKMTDFLDAWRANRRNIYRPFYDRVVGRLLIAMGEPELARRRLDEALELAEETGMHCYDAELLRLRAHTHADPVTRQADLAAARALAQRQGAPLFELRAALDDFDLTGDQARAALTTAVSRLPVDCAFPEYRRAVAITSPLAPT